QNRSSPAKNPRQGSFPAVSEGPSFRRSSLHPQFELLVLPTPTLPKIFDDHRKPLTRYSAIGGALARGLLSSSYTTWRDLNARGLLSSSYTAWRDLNPTRYLRRFAGPLCAGKPGQTKSA